MFRLLLFLSDAESNYCRYLVSNSGLEGFLIVVIYSVLMILRLSHGFLFFLFIVNSDPGDKTISVHRLNKAPQAGTLF